MSLRLLVITLKNSVALCHRCH